MNPIIRLATNRDSEAILKIYSPYIRETAISFETEVPTVQEFSCRIEAICKQYPYLVCQMNDEIVGYAYASKHRERAAYRYDVDVSIYVSPHYHGSGIAVRLYDSLFKILHEQGYINAYAGIAVPNEKSMNFHRKFGFTLVGIYHHAGYKFEQWHDVAWLEKTIPESIETPKPIQSISDLSDAFLKDVFSHTCN